MNQLKVPTPVSSMPLLDDLGNMELQPIKTERLPLVDQVLDVARMLPTGCDEQLETLSLAKHILSCYAAPVMIVKSSNAKRSNPDKTDE